MHARSPREQAPHRCFPRRPRAAAVLGFEMTKGRLSPALRFPLDDAAYFAAISASVVSSMRLLKPHSLSYHESTFTSVPPMTRVCVLS